MDTGATAVMVARGSYGNPWVFSQAKEILAGKESTVPGLVRRIEAFECHMRLLAACGAHLKRGRSLANWYLKGMPEAAFWRGEANKCTTLDEFRERADQGSYGGGRGSWVLCRVVHARAVPAPRDINRANGRPALSGPRRMRCTCTSRSAPRSAPIATSRPGRRAAMTR